MVRCSIRGCKSDSERKISGLSFHSFPDDPALRILWVNATGRMNWEPKSGSRICSQHFLKQWLRKKGNKTFLHPDAVPNTATCQNTVDPVASTSSAVESSHASSSAELAKTLKRKLYEKQKLDQIKFKKMKTQEQKDGKISETIGAAPSSSSPESAKTLKRKLNEEQKLDQLKLKKMKSQKENEDNICETIGAAPTTESWEISTSISPALSSMADQNIDITQKIAGSKSPDLHVASPEYTPRTLKKKWKKEKETSEQRLKSLKALREKSRRLTKKVATLENIIADLKSKLFLSEEDCELISTIDSTNKEFLMKVVNPDSQLRRSYVINSLKSRNNFF